MTKSLAKIDVETLRAVCHQVIPRLRRVIREKEGYIE